MDKCKLLEEVERPNTSKTKLGLKVLSFCFCVVFLGSVLLNVYYIRNMTENKNGVHNGHNSQQGHGLAQDRNSKIHKLEMNLKNTGRKLVKPSRNVGDCEGGADCGGFCCMDPGFPVCCSDSDDFTNWCGATFDDCPSSTKKLPKMTADKDAKLVKPTRNVGDCEGGADCGGFCCMDPGFPVCCSDSDDFTNWCAATFDDCPSSAKKLPKMAADKRSSKKDCDGTDCGNGWCCNESDYPVCCPVGGDGFQWCANTLDECPFPHPEDFD